MAEKPFNIQSCYTEIQELAKHYGPPLVVFNNQPTYNEAFWIRFFNLAIKLGSEYSLPPKQGDCDKDNPTEYSNGNMETILLMIGLSSLAWLSINTKRKTEEGHCRNPAHNLKDGHPNCSIGRTFHGKLYNDLLKILEQISETIRIDTSKH